MSDVILAPPPKTGPGASAGANLSKMLAVLARGDIMLAIGVIGIMVVLILPLPPFAARSLARRLDHLLGADPDDGAVHRRSRSSSPSFPTVLLIATMLRLALNLASTRLILAHGHNGHRGRRPRHRGVRQLRHGRQFRHRHHRLRDPDHRELHRHHQGLGPHRRSRGALHPRRHARQADGDRRRPLGRPDRRAGGQEAAQGRSRTKAPSSAPWTAPRSSCAATPSPACSSPSSTSSAASSSASCSRA